MTNSNLLYKFIGFVAATTGLLMLRTRRSDPSYSWRRPSHPDEPERSTGSSWPPPDGVYWGM